MSLVFLRTPLCSARNPSPKPNKAHSSPGPPLLLRFRPSPRQIDQHLKTLGIRAESLDWILSAVSFLRSKGFSDHQLSRLLLSCSVEHRLRPTLAFQDWVPAESLGLSHEESTGICRRFPAIFRYSEENNLRPKFEYLVCEMGGISGGGE